MAAGGGCFEFLMLMSITKPPQTATIQKSPPLPPGEKKVASAIFDTRREEKSAMVAIYLFCMASWKKRNREQENAIAPIMPVSPRIMRGSIPFSIDAEKRDMRPC